MQKKTFWFSCRQLKFHKMGVTCKDNYYECTAVTLHECSSFITHISAVAHFPTILACRIRNVASRLLWALLCLRAVDMRYWDMQPGQGATAFDSDWHRLIWTRRVSSCSHYAHSFSSVTTCPNQSPRLICTYCCMLRALSILLVRS